MRHLVCLWALSLVSLGSLVACSDEHGLSPREPAGQAFPSGQRGAAEQSGAAQPGGAFGQSNASGQSGAAKRGDVSGQSGAAEPSGASKPSGAAEPSGGASKTSGVSGQGDAGRAGASRDGGNGGGDSAGQRGSERAGEVADRGGPGACVPGAATIVGNVGSVAFRESYSKNGFAQPYDSPDLMLLVGEEGRLFARPTTPLAAGQASSITGLLQLPETRARAASFVCAGAGSRLTLDPKGNVPWSARLSSLSKLGACPGGTPVAGEVAITLGDGRQPSGMTSTIEGAPFAVPVGDVAVSSNADNAAVTAEVFSLSPMGSVVFSFERAGAAPLAEGAFLIVPEGGPDAGAVYCAGAGSTVRTGGSGSDFFLESVSLQGLTRLGTCQGAAAEGELYLCGG